MRRQAEIAASGVSHQVRALTESLMGMRPEDLLHLEAHLGAQQSRYRLIKMSAKRWAIIIVTAGDSEYMRDVATGKLTRRVQWEICEFVKGARSLSYKDARTEIARLRRMEDAGAL